MFHKDYIVRQVQQLTQVIERVLSLKRSKQLVEATELINNTLLEVFSIDTLGVLSMSESELVLLCSPNGILNDEEAIVLAELLTEEGYTSIDLGKPDLGQRFYTQALVLYEAALRKENAVLPLDICDRIDALKDSVGT